MNLLGWVFVIFVAHIAMYYALGTDNWLGTAALATAVWAAALYAIRYFVQQRRKAKAR